MRMPKNYQTITNLAVSFPFNNPNRKRILPRRHRRWCGYRRRLQNMIRWVVLVRAKKLPTSAKWFWNASRPEENRHWHWLRKRHKTLQHQFNPHKVDKHLMHQTPKRHFPEQWSIVSPYTTPKGDVTSSKLWIWPYPNWGLFRIRPRWRIPIVASGRLRQDQRITMRRGRKQQWTQRYPMWLSHSRYGSIHDPEPNERKIKSGDWSEGRENYLEGVRRFRKSGKKWNLLERRTGKMIIWTPLAMMRWRWKLLLS